MRFWRSHAFHQTSFALSTGSWAGRQRIRKRSDVPIHSDLARPQTTGLVEVLDRVLDKGLFVGGDIKISLAEVELLTIRIRLIVCSLDKAREIGLDWWTHDRHLARQALADLALDTNSDNVKIETLEEVSTPAR